MRNVKKSNYFSKKSTMDICDRIEYVTSDVFYEDQKPNLTTPNFVDTVFPPNLQSLLYLDPHNENTDVTEEEKQTLKLFKWKRAKDIFKKDNFLLYEKIEINDINQGQIGNCYFLSAVSSLAEFEKRFDDIFITKEKSDNGCYVVRMNIEGIPHKICVDDHFPMYYNWFAGAHSGRDELWVQVLEKVWAKINKSYAGTIAGLPSEALACLTNAPCISYIHRRYQGEKKEEIWKILSLSDSNNYIICTNTCNNKEAEAQGLVRSHAYSIISAFDFENLKLVKLRNPWGKFEWKGDFSDNSEKWRQYPQLQEKVGLRSSDDGVFFMTFDDFLKYFPYTFICKYENGFYYRYAKIFQENPAQMTTSKIVIKNNTQITITLHQKQARFFNKVKNYKPQMSRIILAKCIRYSKINYKFISSSEGDQDKIHLQLDNLEPGEYHIFSNVNWTYDYECSYTISTYASSHVEVEPIKSEEIPSDYLIKIVNSYLDQKCPPTTETPNLACSLSLEDNDTGFFFIRFQNKNQNSEMEVKMPVSFNEYCELLKDDNVKLEKTITPNIQNSFNITTCIPPGCSQLLIWKQLTNYWNCKLSISNPNIKMLPSSTIDYRIKYRSVINEKMKFLKKEYFSIDGFYSELELEDCVLIVFFNSSKHGEVHKHKIVLEKSTNLNVLWPENGYLSVSAGNFEYVCLHKIVKNEEHEYLIKHSFKKH